MLIPMDIFAALIEDLRSGLEARAEMVRPLDSKELDRRVLCPHCRQEMDTHIYGGGGNVVISDCERCEMNWLDHGELDRIVRAPDRQFSLDHGALDRADNQARSCLSVRARTVPPSY